ncbi:hypothetical protein DPMN_165835 [Dreissena polymorpha]|uniref:Uncharacterized protein n=1 Tax=Dreissena polymorpha TaxID=45954 RepID=A0A9D4EYD1_DREPO|nr:hypothetical protein DPMN_165835 [Dreissena polymorpha]
MDFWKTVVRQIPREQYHFQRPLARREHHPDWRPEGLLLEAPDQFHRTRGRQTLDRRIQRHRYQVRSIRVRIHMDHRNRLLIVYTFLNILKHLS